MVTVITEPFDCVVEDVFVITTGGVSDGGGIGGGVGSLGRLMVVQDVVKSVAVVVLVTSTVKVNGTCSVWTPPVSPQVACEIKLKQCQRKERNLEWCS